MSYQGARGWRTLAKAEATPTLIWYQNDGVIIADLYDKPWRDSKGEIPPELVIVCPRCTQFLSVSGDNKGIRIEYIEPRRTVLPSGTVVVETCRVTIDEPIACIWPATNGKGLCGWRVKVTDGRAHRV